MTTQPEADVITDEAMPRGGRAAGVAAFWLSSRPETGAERWQGVVVRDVSERAARLWQQEASVKGRPRDVVWVVVFRQLWQTTCPLCQLSGGCVRQVTPTTTRRGRGDNPVTPSQLIHARSWPPARGGPAMSRA